MPLGTARSVARVPRSIALILGGIVLAATVLRFWGLGHQSFWYDEGLTVMEIHHSLGRMLGVLPHIESNPPVYYTLAWGWARIFGFGEAGLRSLSAVAGVATIPVLYGAGAKLLSRRAGLVAAALGAFNPLLIWYSQEARSYSLAVLFAGLAWLAFAYARLPGASTAWYVAWGVAAALTMGTHYYGVLAIAPQAAWLLVTQRRDRRTWLAVAGVGAVGAALVPLVVSQEKLGNWISTYPFDRRLAQLAPQAVLGTGAPARDALKIIAAVALAVAAAILAMRADPRERRGALLAGAMALGGFVLALLLVVAGIDDLLTRNVIVLLIPLILLVAGGLGARRAAPLGLAGAAALCVIGLVAIAGIHSDWVFQKPNWRGLARALNSHVVPGAGRAVLVQADAGLYPLALYLPGLTFVKRTGLPLRELDVLAPGPGGPDGAWFCWWGSSCNMVPTPLDTSIHLRGFHPDGVLHVSQFWVLRMVAPTTVRVTPTTIKRAVRKTWLRSYWVYAQPRA